MAILDTSKTRLYVTRGEMSKGAAAFSVSVQHHLPHAPVDTGCISYVDLENGFAIAVRHLVTRPPKPVKVADKPAQATQPAGLWVFVPRLAHGN